MATSLTRNLKLKVDSNLTANAKFNLERIDDLGAIYLVDNQETVNIRSKVNITFRPEDPSVGGSGTGGIVTFGQAGQTLDNLLIYSDNTFLSGGLSLGDQATGGNKSLRVSYKSDINGPVDTGSDRNLLIDTDGADRSLVLGGNLSTSGGNLALQLSADSNLSLPTSGTLATLAGPEVLTNKTIDANSNTLSNIANANISSSAAIAYSKLALSNSILNADINTAAAISYSKLNLSSSIVNSDISASAAISYGKLALTNSITDSDINDAAAISGTKILPEFGNQTVSTLGRFRLDNGSNVTDILPAMMGQSVNLAFYLPPDNGSAGQVLSNDGSGMLSWVTPSGGGSGGRSLSSSWTSGTSKTVTHNWSSFKIMVQVLDTTDNYRHIEVDSILHPDNDSISLTSSEAPTSSGWLVLLQEIVL